MIKRLTPGHRSYRWRHDGQQCRTSAIRAYGRGTVKIYAPLGVYMVPGNHEYISGIEESEIYSADAHRTFKGFRGYLDQSDPTRRTGRPA